MASEVNPRFHSGFEWRAGLGAWRWLILGALGVSATSCEGTTDLAARGTPTQPSACLAETVLEGGLSRCDNGVVHRVAAGACASPWSSPTPFPEEFYVLADAGYDYPCRSDADCTEGPFGRCSWGFDITFCGYGCLTDDDCNDSQLCLCGADGGLCVRAACRTDAACGTGSLCATNAACDRLQFVCQKPGDACVVDDDCAGGEQCQLGDFIDSTPLAARVRVCRPQGCPVH